MAIAFDTAGSQYTASGTTNTLGITPSGSANFMIAFVMTNLARTVSGVTWNGVSMTQIGSPQNATAFKLYAFYLVAPATGLRNLVSTIDSSGETYLGAIFYSGAKQTGQPDASASSNGSGTSITQTVTTIADNSWTACCTLADSGGLAASTNSTLRASILNTAWGMFDSNGPKTPAGSTSMVQTMTSGNRAGIIVSIAPSVTATSFPDLRLAFI